MEKQPEQNLEEKPFFDPIVKPALGYALLLFIVYTSAIYLLKTCWDFDHGKMGDAFGALNALAAFLGFMMVAKSIQLQRRDISTQVEQLSLSKDEFIRHTKEMERQSNLLEFEKKHRIDAAKPIIELELDVKMGFSNISSKDGARKYFLKIKNFGGVANHIKANIDHEDILNTFPPRAVDGKSSDSKIEIVSEPVFGNSRSPDVYIKFTCEDIYETKYRFTYRAYNFPRGLIILEHEKIEPEKTPI